MHLFFEEDGGFKTGTVLEALGKPDTTGYQVELPSGKRIKIKAANVLFQFAQPAPTQLLEQAEALANDIDIAFLHEVAPQDEFDIAVLGAEYHGAPPTPVQSAALLLRVHGAPMYFRRRGKGKYKSASASELQAALAGLERKRLVAEQQARLVEQLKHGDVPEAWRAAPPNVPAGWLTRAAWLLFKPDKNGLDWKALDQAARETHTTPARLLVQAGAFNGAYDLHRAAFLVEWFPKGPDVGRLAVARPDAKLPLADVQAFSIDDSETTEIDDAFSVRFIDDGCVRIGVHIAAPGIAIEAGDAIDAIARQRLSTVYMPGEKITMLPDEVIAAYTLAEGEARAAVSLYADFELDTGACRATDTRLERVPIVANLRHDQLDAVVTEEALSDETTAFAYKRELQALWRIARHLSAQRDQVRGKPEPRNRADFSFRVERRADDDAPCVRIEQRRRDAPLDRLVAEWMIFANSTWGRRLDDAGIPAIYRTQTHWARPGAKQSTVRMSTAPGPHLGMGVTHYAWSSSPLRRYVDLVNQWQLLALLRLQRPPFEKGSAELFAVVGAFEAAHAAYAEVQTRMERYWCMRWLRQENAIGTGRRFVASVLRNERVRFEELPLALPFAAIAHLAPGTRIELEVTSADEIELALELRLATVLSQPETHVDAEHDARDGEDAQMPGDKAAADETPSVETLPGEMLPGEMLADEAPPHEAPAEEAPIDALVHRAAMQDPAPDATASSDSSAADAASTDAGPRDDPDAVPRDNR